MDAPFVTSTRTEHGYTLVELLTIVAILSVLASIAIPMVMSQRQSAWQSSVASDVRAAAILIESARPDGLPADMVQQGRSLHILSEAPEGDVPAVVPAALGAAEGGASGGAILAEGRTSPGVHLTYHTDTEARNYCLCGYHERLGTSPAAVYDSVAGGLVDACGIEAVACTVSNGSADPQPVRFLGVTLNDQGRWERDLIQHLAQAMEDGEVITDGSLTLRDVQASFGRETQGGWALSYGTYDHDGLLESGYTVQFDRGIDRFVIREWYLNDAGQRRERWTGTANVRPPDGWDWTAAQDVELDVNDGRLRLTVGGEEMIAHDMTEGFEGAFGIRTWHDTRVDYAEASVNNRS